MFSLLAYLLDRDTLLDLLSRSRSVGAVTDEQVRWVCLTLLAGYRRLWLQRRS